MHKVGLLFYFLLVCIVARTQNLFSVIHHHENPDYKTVKPKKIVETNTFYMQGDNQVDRSIKTFDEAGMILLEERFDENGKLIARLTYTNDTLNKLLLTRTFERWANIGYSKVSADYTYDRNNYLIGITDKDANDHVLCQSNILNNEQGHPIELAIFDGKGNPYGKETASYLYDKNRVITTVLTVDGRPLSVDTMKLSFINAYQFPEDDFTYNEKGDIVYYITRSPNGVITEYEYDYSYDKFGNCTLDKKYRIIVKSNGKRKRVLTNTFKREYIY